jgi:hypothetical protein
MEQSEVDEACRRVLDWKSTLQPLLCGDIDDLYEVMPRGRSKWSLKQCC